MMPDIRDQLRSYAELLDAAAPPVSRLAPDPTRAEAPVVEPEAPRPVDVARRRRVPAVAALSAAAVAVLAVVGVVALVRGGDDVVGTTSAPTTSTTVATTVPEEPPALAMTRLGGDSVVDVGVEGSDFTGPGGVVFADGLFHMFRNGAIEERLDPDRGNKVGYLVSSDGIEWTEPDPAPLWTDADVPYGAKFARARTAVRDPSGVWRVYFVVGREAGGDGEKTLENVIGMATSPEPGGPWTVLPEPVLTSAEGGYIDSPSVLVTESGFVMFFVDGPDPDNSSVRRATSIDGVAWTVDPDPVLVSDQDWERGSIVLVDAEFTGDTWVLFYSGDTRSRRGFATSIDGSAFTKFEGNPVVDTTMLPRGSVFDSEVVFAGGRWHLYIENGGTRTTSEIVLLAYDGALPPR